MVRRPSIRSAAFVFTGSATKGRSPGSKEASASMTQTMSLLDVHHARPVRRGDGGRGVGRTVVRDDGPEAVRHPGQHPGQSACLVEARQDDIDFHGDRQYFRGWANEREKGLIGPYEGVTVLAGWPGAVRRAGWLQA